MLKSLKFGRKSYRMFQEAVASRRSFLSEAYRCTEAWQARLQTPLLQKIKPSDYFIEIDHKQTTTGKVSAIDVDILANSVQDQYQLEEVLTTVYNLRLSEQTSDMLDSTHHAIIRYLLDNDFTEELMTVLHDRLNYGIFPDYVCYNILMDTYLKRKDYASAAKIAVLPMLQEDDVNPITNSLSVYSCHKYLEKPDDWVKPQPPEDTGEEIKVRVNYIINDYFDDHFDLTDPRDLVGKTLAFYGKLMNDTLGRTCQLRGLILYKKYEEVSDVIEQWLKDVKDDIVYEEVFDLIQKDNKNVPEEEIKDVMSQVDRLKAQKTCKSSLTEAIENTIKSAVDKQAHIDIAEQLKTYINWGEKRKLMLELQVESKKRQTRLQNIEKIKQSLIEQERLLTFFDKEEKIELKIESLKSKEEMDMKKLLRNPRAEYKLRKLKEEEVYIPPTL
ncbi:uncharacterized protein LOC143216016 [Lasioglossum baleicum]|uniref:uncharacterized protein LOC143216016 n=1 Tax=Lasioglossum baleicum TaxID=434251 RepID=UPI003FCDEC80